LKVINEEQKEGVFKRDRKETEIGEFSKIEKGKRY
jgi:hypothetical protein